MPEEIEQKKEYLKQYGAAVRQMVRSELVINELRMNKMHPSFVLSGSPCGSAQSDLSAYAVKLEEETEKYLKARYQRIRLCMQKDGDIRERRVSTAWAGFTAFQDIGG